MRYSEEIIEQVREANPILDVIGSYVHLEKKGGNYFGLCPFHGEKTPSFSVTPSKGMYYCFGCGAGGNLFSFIMQYENQTFTEAVQTLAERAGIQLPEERETDDERRARDRRSRLLDVQKDAAVYFHHALYSPAGERGLEYLTRRGLSKETITSFGLGYAPAGQDRLYRYLKSRGYEDSLLRDSGLVRFSEQGVRDYFWNRVMFPIMDANSHVIGFGGRVMGDGEPKYLNSPETPVFDKSRNLYGLHAARRTRRPEFLICEGYMDVISMHQAGFTNAVASLGTAFTEQHALLIRRFVKNAVLTYDSDGAGVRAAMRAIPMLRAGGLSVRVLDLRPHKDPDEFIVKEGAEAFAKRIDAAVNSFLFEIDVIGRNYNLQDPEEQTAYYREAAGRLAAAFPEPQEREYYTRACARQMMVSYENLKNMVNAVGAVRGRREAAPERTPGPSRTASRRDRLAEADRKVQRLLLTMLCEEPQRIAAAEEYLTPADFSGELYQAMAEAVFAAARTGKVDAAALLNPFLESDDAEEAARVFNTRYDGELSEKQRSQAFYEAILAVKQKSVEKLYDDPQADFAKIFAEQKKLDGLKRRIAQPGAL